VTTPNLERFSGFADLYDAHRPSPPARLGPLLATYAGAEHPDVVDLGSGTGLSSRWAASWAASVIGVEPNPDMRAQAEARGGSPVTYRAGTAQASGLPDACADVVLAVQALHWMEPEATFAEVARLLRPGGVFAAIDADWPPVSGLTAAEEAWAVVHRRVRVFEARAAAGVAADELRRPVDHDDDALRDEDLHDPHRNRAMPGNVRSWSKSGHLDRMGASGRFRFTRELLLDEPVAGGAERFIALMRSQGSYQGLRRLGLSDEDMGVDAFDRQVQEAFAAARHPVALSFSWRVRLGCT
jgi:SAM-dependent methyltransferase